MARTQARPRVAVEILVEEYVILPEWIEIEQIVPSVEWAPPISIGDE
ncbi:MAG: hypothetical protein HKN29_12615 [Rhodothermales bacterium]|nr:hypothetical protein [Rhodothermales bacterium]